ncbi:hypothetical protein A2U01_0082544, partial [Trifolium medium]|nr:hypothetical protein [Trifolium medium]
MLVDSSSIIHEKQDSLLGPEAGLPVLVVAGVELSAVAKPASFLYDASQLAPDVLDIGDALLAVVATLLAAVATSEPTYYLQGPSQILL